MSIRELQADLRARDYAQLGRHAALQFAGACSRRAITQTPLGIRRLAYVMELARCADTVTLLRVEEVEELLRRAEAGEFDNDLEWRQS